MNAFEMIAVEYSPKQGCFYVHTLFEAIQKNAVALRAGHDPGFILIGLFETDNEADRYIRMNKEVVNNGMGGLRHISGLPQETQASQRGPV